MPASIVIPCHNGEAFLGAAIRSGLEQTTPPLEVIVVDDGSTDDSALTARAFGDPVRVVQQSQEGVSAARNAGLRIAGGTHVLFLDADDLLQKESLANLFDAAGDDPNRVVMMGARRFTVDPEAPFQSSSPKVHDFFPGIISGNPAPGSTNCFLSPVPLMRRIGGFDPKIKIFEDWECWCRLALAGGRLTSVSFQGGLYRRHAGSTMANQIHKRSDDVVRGHVAVMATLARGFLNNETLRAQHGPALFWPAMTAARRAAARPELADQGWELMDLLTELVRSLNRRELSGQRLAILGRYVDLARLEKLRSMVFQVFGGTSFTEGPETRPSWDSSS